MFRVHFIDSLDLPELAPYRTLKRPVAHETQGIFVAESDKVVRRLLASHFGVVSVMLPEKRLAEFEPLLRARPEREIAVYVVTKKSLLEELIGFELFQYFVIHALCMYCAISALTTLLLFIVAVWNWRATRA